MIEILTDNHYETIMKLFDRVKRELKIVSPFLSEGMADRLCETVSAKGVECTFITRVYVQDFFERTNSIAGLEKMLHTGIKVYAAVGLHTKLYLFDGAQAVMGSANFTASGLKTNIELSLLFSEEAAVVQDLDRAFCDLLQRILAAGGGEITSQMLDEARKLTLRVWRGNKTAQLVTKNSKMYGAVLDKKALNWEEELDRCQGERESDVVYRAFQEAQTRSEIRYDHTIWLKFDGDAKNRIDKGERFPLVSVLLDGKRVYVQNYPWKPSGVKDGDEVYLAAITTDSAGKNQPIIAGRGTLRGFRPSNHFDSSWLANKDLAWMKKYPWFCVMDTFEILNTGVENGIELDKVYMELGSDTYLTSFGRAEDIPSVAQKHYQKAHLRLSGNAKEFIDRKFDELVRIYGSTKMRSEI